MSLEFIVPDDKYNPIHPKYRPAHEEPPSREKKWQDGIDERIREAQERGDFDNLRGKGKPLDLRGNPYAGDWEMAYNAMANAGYVPDWIDRDKEIRQMQAEADAALERHIAWHNQAVAELDQSPAPQRGQRRQLILDARVAAADRYRARARAINSKILDFNLLCPVVALHKFSLRPDEVIERFEARLASVPEA